MPHSADSLPLPFPDAPQSAPEAAGGVPIPSLSTEPPLDDLMPLAGSGELGEPSEPAKPRRGRPPGSKNAPKLSMHPDAVSARRRRAERAGRPVPVEPVEDTPHVATPEELANVSAALAMGFGLGSKLLASKRGSHWELSSGEAGMLGEAWATALAPWLSGVGKAVPWVTAVMVTAGLAAPRLVADAERSTLAPSPEAVAIAPPPVAERQDSESTAPVNDPTPHSPLAGGGPILPPKRRK